MVAAVAWYGRAQHHRETVGLKGRPPHHPAVHLVIIGFLTIPSTIQNIYNCFHSRTMINTGNDSICTLHQASNHG